MGRAKAQWGRRLKRLWRYIWRFALVLALLGLGLASPVAYVETMCKGPQAITNAAYVAIIDPAHHRPETRTLMTYPEWDIVHAYEDYAQVIAAGDPHEFGYFRAIGGFWSSLCSLTHKAPDHGQIDGATKQMVYVIGVSFTAELLLKAAYEETLGRLFAALRRGGRAPLDDVSARQSAEYAKFLQQVPWYKWDFRTDADNLKTNATGILRDTERRIALGLEYRAKAAYADVIANAVAQTGPDELTLRMIAKGADPSYFDTLPNVRVITQHPQGIEIETPRYRALTRLLVQFAQDGIEFVEIAGNDDIMFTALSNSPTQGGAIFSRQRQGTGDYRHLILVKVTDLANQLQGLAGSGIMLEHIHDY